MNETVALALNNRVVLFVGRTLLASFFLIAGVFGVFNFSAVTQEMVSALLPAPEALALATIATQLIGSFLLITNIKSLGWLGSVSLAIFTLLCVPLGHPFWIYEDTAKRMAEMQIALEHIALSGGLIIAAIHSVNVGAFNPRTATA